MNTIQDQTIDKASVSVYPETAAEVKLCTGCKNELQADDDIRRTSFGLNLCEDCLYM